MLSSVLALSMLGPTTPVDPGVVWRSEPGCVASDVLGPRITGLLGEPVPRATLELAATREADRWRIWLGVRSDAQRFDRTLTGHDCTTLTEAVALIVAMQLDPLKTASTVAPGATVAATRGPTGAGTERPMVPAPVTTDPSPPETPVTASPPAITPAAEGPAPRRRPRVRAVMGTAVAGELGVLPRGAVAVELSAGVQRSWARLELGGSASLGPDAIAPARPTVGGRFRLFTGLVRGCGVLGREPWQLPLCAGMELGDLRGTGTGLTRPATVDALWLATVAGARPQWVPHPRVAVGALLDVVVPLRRHRFATADSGLVHEVDPIAARLGLRLEVRLP